MRAPAKFRISAKYVLPDGRTGLICGYVLNREQTVVIGLQVRIQPGKGGTQEVALPRSQRWSAA